MPKLHMTRCFLPLKSKIPQSASLLLKIKGEKSKKDRSLLKYSSLKRLIVKIAKEINFFAGFRKHLERQNLLPVVKRKLSEEERKGFLSSLEKISAEHLIDFIYSPDFGTLLKRNNL